MTALNRPVNRVKTGLSMRDVLMVYIGRLSNEVYCLILRLKDVLL